MSQPRPSRRVVQRPIRGERRPLLSLCTILILSGFLLGMSIGTELSGSLRVYVSLAGLVGMVSFLGLDHVAARRRTQLELKEQEYIESRLVKHVDSNAEMDISTEELMKLAREATESVDLDELIPA